MHQIYQTPRTTKLSFHEGSLKSNNSPSPIKVMGPYMEKLLNKKIEEVNQA